MVIKFVLRLLLAGGALALAGCSDQSVTVELRSLQASGDVSYVCRSPGTGNGLPLSECHARSVRDNEADLYALVTQTSTGEVAVVNVPLDFDDRRPDEGVVDLDLSTPGFGFVRIGAQPTDIVSTPGGAASFVAVAELGRYGIFGLPTQCLSPPASGEPARDLTTWPACRLSSAPGNIEILVDAQTSCEAAAFEERGECSTDLAEDESAGPQGKRKLLVTLPDTGSLVVIDAQWLLNQPIGAFPACRIDAEYPLSATLPLTLPEQRLPSDLNECARAVAPEPAAPATFTARPTGLAHDDGILYVSDGSAPLIHVLDVARPCAATELLPLVPRSFDAPDRVVTSTGVSLSPVTPSGKRFLYAIDDAGNLMVFDVSPGSTDRTPLVRPGAPFLPFESPDRIAFDGAVKDVTFFLRDRPALDPSTGTGIVGQACEPSPEIANGPGTAYRPNNDYSTGANADELRGVFAAVVLSRGSVALIDVDDFDAPCRRPVRGNQGEVQDFRGCSGDEFDIYQSGGVRTVTGEVSCRMVQPHRPRASNLGITSSEIGIRAPSLRSFPQLTVPSGIAQRSINERPKLLGVPFPNPNQSPNEPTPAQVFVGTTLYSADPESPEDSQIVIDPATARQHSVVLPFIEPRAYAPSQEVVLSFEGPITGTLSTGFLLADETGALTLRDGSANYCDRGVHDPELVRELGAERFALEGEALERFAQKHADYVIVQSDFPEEDETDYWDAVANTCSRQACEELFGEVEDDENDFSDLSLNRDFRIVDADQNRLLVEPRPQEPADRSEASRQAELDRRGEVARLAPCCFPTGLEYVVRASQQWVVLDGSYRHDIVADPATLQCVRDCNPKKQFFNSRVFEIAAAQDSCPQSPSSDETEICAVGPAGPDDVCVIDASAGGVKLDEPAARCIHSTPTARFAVYRGSSPSERGMAFRWETLGGFQAMSLNLALSGVSVLPQSIVGLRELDWLTIVDAESLGLTVIDLNRLSVLTPTVN